MESYQVSVIIPSYNSRGTISRCLAALESQQTPAAYEIIVVDSSTDGTADHIAEAFPGVRLIRSGQRLYPGAARNMGIAVSSGGILAFTDADCIADPGWLAAIINAHQGPEEVIGGVVANANPDSVTGWGYYFTEFNQWSPGPLPGAMGEIPTCCLSMKRSAFERWGPFVAEGYCSDTLFHWRRAEDGGRPYLDPSIRVAHINPDGFFHMITHEFSHGEFFAGVRARYQALSRMRLLLHAAGAPLLPFVLFGRAAARINSRGYYRGAFVRASLQTFAGMLFWSLGECAGNLFGLLAWRTPGELKPGDSNPGPDST